MEMELTLLAAVMPLVPAFSLVDTLKVVWLRIKVPADALTQQIPTELQGN